MDDRKISKREFIKQSALAGCGCLLCLNSLPLKTKAVSSSLTKPWKWSIEAKYFIDTPRGIKCLLCPNDCVIEPGELGDCHTRVNESGKLYSIAYGNPCSVNVDPIEKKPLSHFYPESKAYSLATAGCNMSCLNCQNWQISQVSPRDIPHYELMPEDVYKQAKYYNCESIAYTYTEPTVFYEYMYDAARAAKQNGIKNVMITNGYINERPLLDLVPYIDAANVDLKGFDEETYMRLNGGVLEDVLRSLKIYKDNGVWLEITNLIVPDWTDDLDKIREMCQWLLKNGFEEYPLHFGGFHPAYKLKHLPSTPVLTLNKAREIALNEGMKHVYIGNVPGSKAQHTYCPNCEEIIIKRSSYRILENNLVNGKCKSCDEKISGVWD